ncbi:UPF0236 family protein [Virgibacillus sp. 179-BFC.A HS]|uniref:UPF0236 family protein n=1 Tax=Tigheibacillus jepli TaxID=3035914 RepID=A0ABU5CK20_9BACI|nr:UPF0236 family protein [Virgibacillus sp. 179-BFC.A HS]MDY0406708.1 UPF0236 family protein [Virgibacillus sp. 179-BFC.A HS]
MQLYMYEVFAFLLGEVFTRLNNVMTQKKQELGWTVERNDRKRIQFIFGLVEFTHTLMHDTEGKPHYCFDEWIGLRKYQRQSSLVELKVAELASECTYRETARVLKEWTAVNISHTTVGTIVKQVGKAQAKADEES